VADKIIAPVVAGFAGGAALIVLFSLGFVGSALPHPGESIVVIPEGASLPSSIHNNFEPEIINVTIGVNNTVVWINRDITASSIIADNQDDPDFFNATSGENSFLAPNEQFAFTFNKPGEVGYHSEPHPHMRGMVVVTGKPGSN
jgi:plastocyanin